MKFVVDANSGIGVEFDAANHKDAWGKLSGLNEVFFNRQCGKCNAPNARFTIRKASDGKKEYDYHELRCWKCGAKKAFGVLDDGSDCLFPKIKDKDGNYLPDNGWVKYNKDTGKEE